MNIIKGLDRIALVIAIIAILPGFGVGFVFIDEEFTTVSPEYKNWEKEKERKKKERIEELRREWEKAKKEEERALQEAIDTAINDHKKRKNDLYSKLSKYRSEFAIGATDPMEKVIRSGIIEERSKKRPELYTFGRPRIPWELGSASERKIRDHFEPYGEPEIDIDEPPNMYDHPVIWCIITGLLSAAVSFLVVLYSLRRMTRGIRWFVLWIIDGFRDEKRKE